MQSDMAKYNITYDKWFFESELHKSGAVKAVVDTLTEKDLHMSRTALYGTRTSRYLQKSS